MMLKKYSTVAVFVTIFWGIAWLVLAKSFSLEIVAQDVSMALVIFLMSCVVLYFAHIRELLLLFCL